MSNFDRRGKLFPSPYFFFDFDLTYRTRYGIIGLKIKGGDKYGY